MHNATATLKKNLYFVNGFQLIELMVSLAIVSSLISLSMPSYKDLIIRQYTRVEVNKWLLAFNFARQTAITSGNIVTVCPSDDGLSCGRNWQSGAIVFIDLNRDHIKDANELLLQTVESVNQQQRVSWRAFQNRPYVQFQKNGFTWAQNGTLRICNDDPSLKYNRALIVTRSGRIRQSTDSNNDGFEEDASGNKISC